MNANTVTAICAVVIAVASLGVSIYQARAVRQHNRHSVRPILQLSRSWHVGGTAGLHLVNIGLGPAVIVECTSRLDGREIGSWQESSVNRIRDNLSIRPSAVTFTNGAVIATGYHQYLLSVAGYDPDVHTEIIELINDRISLKIRYESLYGGENYEVSLTPPPPAGSEHGRQGQDPSSSDQGVRQGQQRGARSGS